MPGNAGRAAAALRAPPRGADQCRGSTGRSHPFERGTARARLEAARRQAGAQLSLLTTELQKMESARTEREARRAEAQGALAELRLALAARQSALEALERLEDDREGYGAGVRAIFSKAAAAE